MATSPLLGSMAISIGKGLAGLFYPAVYEVDGPTTGAPHDPIPGAATQYPCLIIEEDFGSYEVQGGLVKGTDRKVMILATSIAVEPVNEGRITTRGRVLTIYSDGEGKPAVSTDPARAVWTVRCRV